MGGRPFPHESSTALSIILMPPSCPEASALSGEGDFACDRREAISNLPAAALAVAAAD